MLYVPLGIEEAKPLNRCLVGGGQSLPTTRVLWNKEEIWIKERHILKNKVIKIRNI